MFLHIITSCPRIGKKGSLVHPVQCWSLVHPVQCFSYKYYMHFIQTLILLHYNVQSTCNYFWIDDTVCTIVPWTEKFLTPPGYLNCLTICLKYLSIYLNCLTICLKYLSIYLKYLSIYLNNIQNKNDRHIHNNMTDAQCVTGTPPPKKIYIYIYITNPPPLLYSLIVDYLWFREAAKKFFFLVKDPLRGGEGVRGCPLRKKNC